MVCDSLGGGGAERQLALLSTSLQATWDVAVCSLGSGIYAEKLPRMGVPLTLVPRKFRFDPSPALKMWRAIGAFQPDVVHSWGHMSCMAADVYCRAKGIPHVAGVIRRGTVYSLRGWMPRLASRLGDLALGNSQAGLTAFGVPAARGRVLHNGFDPDRLALAQAANPPETPFHLVMAATMDDRKDFSGFITAVRRLQDDLPTAVKATALGGGPRLEALRADAADLLAAGTLSMPGRVDEPMDYLKDAHVGVLLGVKGWGEGISNSIMEYMAAGLPVVCSDSGGNPELVLDGQTGFLVEPENLAGLVERLTYLAENRDKVRVLGAAGRRRIETDFSVPTMTTNASRIYEEAISRRGG